MSALVVVARNKCGYRGVWTAYKKMKRSKFILVELVTNSTCATEKQKFFLFLMTLLCFFGDFIENIPKRKLLCRFNTLYIHTTFNFNKKTQFYHLISLNITILLCLQVINLDCNKILMSLSQLYLQQ